MPGARRFVSSGRTPALVPIPAILLAASFASCAAPPPNVVLFVVDDMGWMDSTPYGSKYYETPNLERLATRGLLFTDAYASPLCSPTRASILTGQYPSRHGVLSATGHLPPQPEQFPFLADVAPPTRPIIAPVSRNYLDPSQHTLAEALRDAGYRTAHIGKWHLGRTAPHWPERQGFEVALHGQPDSGPPSYFSPYRYLEHQSIPDGPAGEYLTDRLTEEAVAFIEGSGDRPFFLNLWHAGVHSPWGHEPEITRRFAGKRDPRGEQGNPIMASMLKSIDDSLGRILDTLDRRGLASNTVVVFYSDNGGNVGSPTRVARRKPGRVPRPEASGRLADWTRWAGDRPPTSNAPLRDGKGSLYEGGTRVPLVISWPGRVAEARRTAAVAHAVDLYPTLLELAGVERDPRQILDGVSLAPVLEDPDATPRREAVFNFFPTGGRTGAGGVSIRAGDWKLIRKFGRRPDRSDRLELHNLRDDLGESTNLAKRQASRARALDERIDRFLVETGALVPKANPAFRERAPGAAARPRGATGMGGWVLGGCTATLRSGVVRLAAETRAPFLSKSGLDLAGPVELRMRLRSGGGRGRVRWRTAGQVRFPVTGQSVPLELASGPDWQEVAVGLPVRGDLAQVQLYLPTRSRVVALDWVELESSSAATRRWEFDGPAAAGARRRAGATMPR